MTAGHASSATIQDDDDTQEKANEAATTAQCLERERQDAHDAALARALQAEEEAAAKDRDVAAQRASEALARAAKERAAAAAPKSSGAAPGGALASTTSLRATMLVHETVALLQLHAQDVAVNI
jgi:hypothetical protein